MLKIVPFESRYFEEAAALALADYERQRQQIPCLPAVEAMPVWPELAENGMGVAAFDGEHMVGFLCGFGPFENAFRSTDVKGVFSPMGGHGAVLENRERIYSAMYQAAAEKWVKAGAVSHALCLYSWDESVQRRFFVGGFGQRCADAIRPMTGLDCQPCCGYEFEELAPQACRPVYPLELALDDHCRQSPFFMNRTSDTPEQFLAAAGAEEARYFVAKQQGEVCAYVKISAIGETFAAAGAGYRHVNGAYCLPEHRGGGLYANLLNVAIEALAQEGYTLLGVDYESINPHGLGFWGKHFQAYTCSVVRRIDERVLRLYET